MKRLLLALAATPVLAALLLVSYAVVITAEAKAVLRDVYALQVGVSSVRDVEKVADRHKRSVVLKCRDGSCDYRFAVTNSWLSSLRIVPWAVFGANVTVEKGTVEAKWVFLARDTRVFPTAPSMGEVTEYRVYPDHMRQLAPYDFPQPIGKPYLHAWLNAQATPEQRRRAYAFSFQCLTKPGGGCDLPCDYLPLAWKDWLPIWENDPIYRRFYPGRARCR